MPKKSNGSANRKSSSGKSRKPAARGAKRNTAIPKAPPQRRSGAGVSPSVPSRAAQFQPARSAQRPPQQRPPQQLQPQSRTGSLPTVSGEITHDMIARRAYEIYLSGTGASEFDNWCRAERELRGS